MYSPAMTQQPDFERMVRDYQTKQMKDAAAVFGAGAAGYAASKAISRRHNTVRQPDYYDEDTGRPVYLVREPTKWEEFTAIVRFIFALGFLGLIIWFFVYVFWFAPTS